jgi:endonuclease YncB( thermonuclease family)
MSRPCQDTAAVAPHSGLSLHGMAVRRDGVLAAMFAAGFAAACGNAPALPMEQQAPRACGGAEVARGTVSRVVDGRTFMLDDGREVRLAAIEVPSVPLPQDAGGSPGGRATAEALNALAGGDQILLRSAEIASDRYGRLVAYAYAMRDGDELFVQGN